MPRMILLVAVAGINAWVLSVLPVLRAAPVPAPSSRHENYTETIPGSKVSFRMVAIPGGDYWRGSPAGEKLRTLSEGPRHPVTIPPFWMGRCEVTWDEYDLFLKKPPDPMPKPRKPDDMGFDAITRPSEAYADETRGFGREGYPVVGISHHAAMEYCRWLSLKTGKAYRLPTEAEWEYACRAGTKTAFHFGDETRSLGEHAWHFRNSEESTHPVGKKKPNPWGLCDMYGNVAEWCLDHYHEDSYRDYSLDRAIIGPVKMPSAARYSHVVRGGSWADDVDRCRSAARRGSDKSWNRADPDRPQSIWWVWNADFVGFRVVRALEEQDSLKGIRSKITKQSE